MGWGSRGHSLIVIGVSHPLGEKVRHQRLAFLNPTGAGGADGINLVVPARGTLGQTGQDAPADTRLQRDGQAGR